MRVISCQLENFASYKQLEFDYSGQGLTLLRGLTGSGKSTLCDAVPWVLFGKTAKGGAVDEVLSWPGDEVTRGIIYLDGGLEITRVRGPKAKDNDLYMVQENDTGTISAQRGKDLPDTQRLINSLLGFDYDLYLAAAYYHEFSQTAQFFTTTAKNRRTICEQLVDLSLATKLQPTLSEERKSLVKQQSEFENKIFTLRTNVDLLNRMFTAETVKHNAWNETKRQRIGLLQDKIVNFEGDKTKTITDLLDREEAWIADQRMQEHEDAQSTVCKECGGPKKTHKKERRPVLNPYTELIERELMTENTYTKQLQELNLEVNPHKDTAEKIVLEREVVEAELHKLAYDEINVTNDLDEIELLQQVVADYRSASIVNTIKDVETETNKLLSNHFDAEIRVVFSVEDADKLDVNIYKDGNQCVFTQLSKGQRCLLKLCFAVAVMQAVQNHHGIKMEQIFLDEALDGLDEILKAKAHDLLLTISQQYDSIFLVEHSSELKASIDNQYHVQLINGESVIEKS